MFDLKSRILVIDDMMTIRKIVKKTLSDLKFTNFIEAENGLEAWKLIQAEPDIQFIISDWNMPKMTGAELLKLIRAEPSTSHIPFIFLTAECEVDQIKEVMAYGADNYILKPFTPNDLKTRLEQTYSKVKDRIKPVSVA